MIRFASFGLLLALGLLTVTAADEPRLGSRFVYLSERDPYYPDVNFPRLTTPMWVGEPGVDAVVLLSIDDMRDPEKYETFLRPLLRRLQEIDGRAPLSIFTCRAVPEQERLQQFLKEGLSLEIHTVRHPCPLLRTSPDATPGPESLREAILDVVDCVRNLNQVPNNTPVAYRMPCCDSQNTVSPRFFSEIFPLRTSEGEFLQADTSVFMVYTDRDKQLKREWVTEPDGRGKFQKYVPFRNFANTIENYPYPYVIDRLCWEFPCLAPSDWSAQNLQQSNNPDTVRDWKVALDATVAKQGVVTLVFHPHGWIKAEQVAELVDYADKTYGKRVKFLNFREAVDRLNTNLLAGNPIRSADGTDNGVRLLDLNADGFLDVVIGNGDAKLSRIWDPAAKSWSQGDFPATLAAQSPDPLARHHRAQFFTTANSRPGVALFDADKTRVYELTGDRWQPVVTNLPVSGAGQADPGIRFRDLNADGRDDLIVNNAKENTVYFQQADGQWQQAPFALPHAAMIVNGTGHDGGLRFVDLNGDSLEDLVLSNEQIYEVHVREGADKGWTKTRSGVAGEPDSLPMIIEHGRQNGVWFHSNAMVLANEFTATQPDLIQKVPYAEVVHGSAPQPMPADQSLKSIQVPDDLQVDLVASEPLTADPVALAFDAHGRMWVVEMGDYPLGPGKGRVRVLEDVDHDGVMDRSTIFAELEFPTGVLPWRKGVLVTAAPNIWYMEDTDGDNKADVKRVLYSGFVEGNQQHRVNGLHYGFDNWVYGANGDSGGTIISERDKQRPAVSLGRQDFRFLPDEDVFEKTSGTTQFGIAFDDWGYRFGCNNRHHLMYYPLEDRYLKRNPFVALPAPVVDIPDHGAACEIFPISTPLERFNDFGHVGYISSACGLSVYRADLLGAEYQGNVFVCEPVSNLVHRDKLSYEGAADIVAHRGDHEREFFASSDNWTRPVFTTTGPDGALYVADMYRLVIEHPRWIPAEFQKKYDLRAGSDKGRIYRVRPKQGYKPVSGDIAELPIQRLVALLHHPNAWNRETAQMQLVWRQDQQAVKPLTQLLTTAQLPVGKIHVLWTLEGLNSLEASAIQAALADPHPEVRKAAILLAERHAGQDKKLAERLLAMTADPSPRVRYQLALALGSLPEVDISASLADLLVQGGDDNWLQTAVLTSARDWAGATLQKLLDSEKWQTSVGDAARQAVVSKLVATLVGRNDAAELSQFVEALAVLSKDSQRRPLALTTLSAFAATLSRQGKSLESWAADRPEFAKILPSLDALLTSARQLALDDEAPLDQRIAALRLFGQSQMRAAQDVQTLAQLVDPVQPSAVQSEAVEVLDRIRGDDVAPAVLAKWDRLTPALRSRVLSLLLARTERTQALLKAIQAGDVLPSQLDAAATERLRQHSDKEIQTLADRLLKGTQNSDRAQVIAQFQETLKLQGDAGRGKETFRKICAACHQLQDIGTDAAPNLTESRNKSPEAMLEAVLDPNRVVDPKYVSYLISTVSGRVLTGLIKSETSNSVVLHKADGTQETVLRSEIEAIKGTGKSLMPEGLEKDLTPQQLADVFAFIRSNDQILQRRKFPGNKPELVSPDEAGTIRLSAVNAEIYGEKIVFEPRYQNLGYWSSRKDHAVWTVQVPATGQYDVFVEWACDDSCAGNSFQLAAGDSILTGVVPGTGDWDVYQKQKFGSMELAAGQQQLTVQPASGLQGSLFDLKFIELVPRK